MSPEQRARLGAAEGGIAPEVGVLACNWDAFRVFRACRWTRLPLFNGRTVRWLYDGIAATEVLAAMDGCNVPSSDREVVFEYVHDMVADAQPLLNAA